MMCSQDVVTLCRMVLRSPDRIRPAMPIGIVTSGAVPTATPKKPGGATPTIVNGAPSIAIERPTTPGSPL